MQTRLSLALLLIAIVGVRPAQAQLLLSFNPAGLTGSPGDTLTFNATLVNDSSEIQFLNGASVSGLGTGLSVDITPFFTNSPLSLAIGEAWTGDIFTVQVDPGATPGSYFGVFDVLGGLTSSDQDALASQNFLVGVSAPEPGTLGLALVGGGLLLRRRRRCSQAAGGTTAQTSAARSRATQASSSKRDSSARA